MHGHNVCSSAISAISVPVNADERLILFSPFLRVGREKSQEPKGPAVYAAEARTGVADGPVGFIHRSEEEALNRAPEDSVTVYLERLGFLRAQSPFHFPGARVSVDTDGVPVWIAGARGDLCLKCVQGAVAAKEGIARLRAVGNRDLSHPLVDMYGKNK